MTHTSDDIERLDVAPHIGTLNEGSLHARLKQLYAEPGDQFEVPIEGFVADIARGKQLIEIQTSGFGAMASKLDRLLEEYEILIVHPIAVGTWLQRPEKKRRKSPTKGSVADVFDELVSVPTLLDHPNLTLDVVLVNVTKVQVFDPLARRKRGGYRTVDRQLDEIIDQIRFTTIGDLAALVPDGLPQPFTTGDLARATGFRRDQAQRMAYCFRPLGVFEEVGRTKAGFQYRLHRPSA